MASITLENIALSKPTDGRMLQQPIINIPFLDVAKGEVLGFFGPNHVGKSSLLKFLSCVDHGFSLNKQANLILDGQPFLGGIATPTISVIAQEFFNTLLPWFSVEKNLRSFAKAKKLSLDNTNANVLEIASQFGFQNEESLFSHFGFYSDGKMKKIAELSGGQKQILTILRALVVKPDIVLMDEPFSAVDIYSGIEFRKSVFSSIRSNNITAIIVSHSLSELVSFCDRIVFLAHSEEGGQIKGIESIDVIDKENKKREIHHLEEKYAYL